MSIISTVRKFLDSAGNGSAESIRQPPQCAANLWVIQPGAACRVQTVDMLAARGLYDETVVTIDVRPDAFPNVIDAAAGGRLTVAIFSTGGFDATTIVPGSLRLASSSTFGAADHPVSTHGQAIDVNGDGRPDLVVEFDLDRVQLVPGDIVIDLWGRTRGGVAFTGSDLVEVVGT